MTRLLPIAATPAAVLAIPTSASAQQCYSPQNQCFSFAPPGEQVDRVETGLDLRSNKLKVTGDIRLRMRFADSPADAPYAGADQQATRTRLQLDYEVNEFAEVFVEFNYSEVWAGAAGYSDAQPYQNGANGILSRENFNGIAQAYMQLEDVFGFAVRTTDRKQIHVTVSRGYDENGEELWYAKSEHTRGLVKLQKALAAEVAADLANVLDAGSS